METYYFSGRLSEKSEIRTGETSGYNWQRQNIVVENSQGENYRPVKLMLGVFGQKVDEMKAYNVGDQIKVGFTVQAIESRMNGKLYNNVDLVSVTGEGKAEPEAKKVEDDEDIPF